MAWHPLGWRAAFFAEIEPFCCALLKQRYPEVPNYGDFTKIETASAIDLLIGGTPCQSFSVAGKRAGLDDPRGNLTLEFLALAGRLRPRWVVWENVSGVLSDDGGRTFGTVLGILGQLGYGFAYRVLDAQHFGVPQRRRRVFVVGYFGDWRPPAAILFERFSLSGHPAPRREAREDVAGSLRSGASGGRSHGKVNGTDRMPMVAGTLRPGFGARGCDDPDRATFIPEIAHSLNAREYKGALPKADLSTVVTHSLRADGFDASEDGTGRGTPLVATTLGGQAKGGYSLDRTPLTFDYKQSGEVDPVMRATSHDRSHANGGGNMAVAFEPRFYTRSNRTGGAPANTAVLKADAAKAGDSAPHVMADMAVRRLTPMECERLQGFPDGYTAITYRGKPAADGPRYRALGNSMAVPVMHWIGQRIQMVEDLLNEA